MAKWLANFRFVALIAVVASFLTAVTMFVAGAVKVAEMIWYYALGTSNVVHGDNENESVIVSHLSQEDGLTARAIEALDTFLIASVLLYFGYGIYALLCVRKDDRLIAMLPSSVFPATFGELKRTLGQIILVVLMVLFARKVWLEWQSLTWEHLVIPGAVLLLGAGMRLAGFDKHS